MSPDKYTVKFAICIVLSDFELFCKNQIIRFVTERFVWSFLMNVVQI